MSGSPAAGQMEGILVVDKPGLPADVTRPTAATDFDLPTSHDVVQRVRRWSRQRRIGHTGTLDPMASGVLVLCLGMATRLVEYYQGHDKQYLADVRLGIATDSYDALGKVTDRQTPPALTVAVVEEALARFRGPILQKPPIFSALKQGGESLHRKARRGEEVQIDARPITIHDLNLVDWIQPDRLRLRIRCSAGTYVRSLAHDLGHALGTVAHLAYLRREAAGAFSLAQAHTLEEIAQAASAGELQSRLLPTHAGLDFPKLVLPPETVRRLGFGQKVVLPVSLLDPAFSREETIHLAQGFDGAGRFVGIIRNLGPSEGPDDGCVCKAEKWFANS